MTVSCGNVGGADKRLIVVGCRSLALLTVENLSRPPLLNPVTFTLEAGECIGVEGPSGSGKSMLLRAIADLDPVEGKVALNDVARAGMPASEWRSRVCYVAAESAWWADLVGDHFADETEGARVADALGLRGAMDWKVARLSTGEGQRLALARALAIGPDILLLDEPTSGLDARATELVIDRVRAFLAAGGAVILVAHNPRLLDELAARRYRMESGTLKAAA